MLLQVAGKAAEGVQRAEGLSVGAWVMLFVGCIILYGGLALCLARALKWREGRGGKVKPEEKLGRQEKPAPGRDAR